MICVLPEIFIPRHLVGFGGTSLLIVGNVTIDTVTQIQSHLLAHQYGDLIKDDPDGFRLPESLLSVFEAPFETFIETDVSQAGPP